jgi:hypothetical protein
MQGDMRPLLFLLYIEPLIRWLNAGGARVHSPLGASRMQIRRGRTDCAWQMGQFWVLDGLGAAPVAHGLEP